ncbi:unnamed protein product [Mycena citricolor]|uniref:Uncharacterized protein n=1 Tax=Mycena citricolor TaxID=2018698 RepID=A0AAD2K2B3_9AGAR|nr:unnamed protein product [Mycena citricolor]CAK5275094.1 unnamed protein product [Mycena citricolor]
MEGGYLPRAAISINRRWEIRIGLGKPVLPLECKQNAISVTGGIDSGTGYGVNSSVAVSCPRCGYSCPSEGISSTDSLYLGSCVASSDTTPSMSFSKEARVVSTRWQSVDSSKCAIAAAELR